MREYKRRYAGGFDLYVFESDLLIDDAAVDSSLARVGGLDA